MLTILCSICIRSALVACPVRGLAAIRGFGLLVLDNNGYVVISKEERDVSRFFGEIDWLVIDSLIIIVSSKSKRLAEAELI